MHITTLGTSHGDSTYCRFNSSTLYESGDSLYLVDCGAPCEALLCRKGKDFHKIRAVFCTHMHNDHVGGLTELIKILLKYKKPGQHTTIFLPEADADKALIGWLNAMHLDPTDDVISFETVKPGQLYMDENISVSAYPTDHIPSSPVKPCTFAYIISEGDKRLLHTGDLWVDFHDYPKILLDEHFDLLLCEATHYKQATAAPLFERSKIDRMIFIHIGNEWHGEGEMKLYNFCGNLPYPVLVAHDGDEFEL
ncbi:MAG: ribonuclease Z [Clostridiales bacterium]|nr:ribonuclease Z [Clostridiales bacterium]